MSTPLFAIVREPLSLDALSTRVEADARGSREGYGAVASFVGVVRATHQGRCVRYLEYEAFAPLAERAFGRIGDEARREWPDTILGVHHRTGRLEVGEASVIIVAASAHRAAAFAACRYAIERVKQIAPVWKHEFFDDGASWVEGAQVAPDDEAARRAAMARSCV